MLKTKMKRLACVFEDDVRDEDFDRKYSNDDDGGEDDNGNDDDDGNDGDIDDLSSDHCDNDC